MKVPTEATIKTLGGATIEVSEKASPSVAVMISAGKECILDADEGKYVPFHAVEVATIQMADAPVPTQDDTCETGGSGEPLFTFPFPDGEKTITSDMYMCDFDNHRLGWFVPGETLVDGTNIQYNIGATSGVLTVTNGVVVVNAADKVFRAEYFTEGIDGAPGVLITGMILSGSPSNCEEMLQCVDAFLEAGVSFSIVS